MYLHSICPLLHSFEKGRLVGVRPSHTVSLPRSASLWLLDFSRISNHFVPVSCATRFAAWLAGTAKPIPWYPPSSEAIDVVMPTT